MDLSFEKRTARPWPPSVESVVDWPLAAGEGGRERERERAAAASLSNRTESDRNGEGTDGEAAAADDGRKEGGKGFPKGSFKRILAAAARAPRPPARRPSYMHIHIGGEGRQAVRAHGN